MNLHQRICFSLGAAIVLLSMADITRAAYLTTGVYDENTVNLNVVDTLAASSNRSIVDFAADIATAFTADKGGVVDFDTVDLDSATSLPLNADPGQASFTARYGASHSKSLVVSRLEYVVGPPAANGMNQNTLTERISGAAAMGLSGTGTYTLAFSSPLRAWGMTALSRGSDRNGTMTITHTDASTYTFLNQTVNGAAGANDTLFAYRAPSGKMIQSVNFAGSFLRWDDMGFAVPEPTSLALVGIFGLGLLTSRRR